MEAQNLFANSRVNITAEYKGHLGAVIWSTLSSEVPNRRRVGIT